MLSVGYLIWLETWLKTVQSVAFPRETDCLDDLVLYESIMLTVILGSFECEMAMNRWRMIGQISLCKKELLPMIDGHINH